MNLDSQPPTSPATDTEFYTSYAEAMLSWQSVESSLFHLYFTMCEVKKLEVPASTFYGQDSFGAKLKIVDCVAGVMVPESIRDKWNSLRESLRAGGGERNRLAHLSCVMQSFPDGTHQLVLTPAPFMPAHLKARGSNRLKLDARGCGKLVQDFAALKGMVDGFLREYLAAIPGERLLAG